MSIRYVLTDIEGTTTPIDFVHKVLFPYSAKNLQSFIAKHRKETNVEESLKKVKATVEEEERRTIDDDGAITMLLRWIKEDRKHPALKELQGHIWKRGYEQKEFTSDVYPDVHPKLNEWQKNDIQLGIYSSGSVGAQKLLFKYTPHGDMNGLFSHYFDTAVGHKREAKSYANITKSVGIPAENILFLSDVAEELDAAKAAGMQTVQLLRPGTKKNTSGHKTAGSFGDILI
jgi:enolase-phosphatase E1